MYVYVGRDLRAPEVSIPGEGREGPEEVGFFFFLITLKPRVE